MEDGPLYLGNMASFVDAAARILDVFGSPHHGPPFHPPSTLLMVKVLHDPLYKNPR